MRFTRRPEPVQVPRRRFKIRTTPSCPNFAATYDGSEPPAFTIPTGLFHRRGFQTVRGELALFQLLAERRHGHLRWCRGAHPRESDEIPRGGYRGGDEVRSSGRTRVKARVKAVQTSGVPPTRAVPEGELARDASRSVPGREVQAIYRRNLQLRHGRRRETRARETARRFVADLLARGNTRLDSSANARTRPWTQKRSG